MGVIFISLILEHNSNLTVEFLSFQTILICFTYCPETSYPVFCFLYKVTEKKHNQKALYLKFKNT